MKTLYENVYLALRMIWVLPRILRLAWRHALWGDVPLESIPGGEQEMERIKEWVIRPFQKSPESRATSPELEQARKDAGR